MDHERKYTRNLDKDTPEDKLRGVLDRRYQEVGRQRGEVEKEIKERFDMNSTQEEKTSQSVDEKAQEVQPTEEKPEPKETNQTGQEEIGTPGRTAPASGSEGQEQTAPDETGKE